MAKNNIVVGLDIGSSKVSVVVGKIEEGLIHIIGAGRVANSGMRKGIVVDIEDCVSATSAALEEAERMAGVPLESAYVGMSGAHISSSMSKGVIAVSRADGEITKTDYERVVEAARAVALPPNREIIDVIPRDFIVDGQGGIKDPVGMTGIRLETEALVIGGQTAAIKNLSKCVFQAGLKIEDIVYTPIALANSFLTKKQKDVGVLLVDIGAGTTSVTVFEEGDMIYTNVIAIGSGHITNDLAIGLRTAIETAEKVKLEFGVASSDGIAANARVDLTKLGPNEDGKVERKMIAEIIEERLKELFSMVRDELKSIGKDGMLPAGVILTGGGSLLEGIVDFAKAELKLPAQIGKNLVQLGGIADKVDNPIYAAAAGLLLTGFMGPDTTKPSGLKLEVPELRGLTDNLKKIFRNFLP